MGTWSTEQLNQGCCVWCLSRCPWTYMLCFAADSTDKSLGLYNMDTVYLQSGSLICCDMKKVQWPWLFLGMGLGLGELQAQHSAGKDWAGCHQGNAAGGLSQTVWLSDWHTGSPEAGFSLQRCFIWPYSSLKKCHATILPFHLLIPSPHWTFTFSSCPSIYLEALIYNNVCINHF